MTPPIPNKPLSREQIPSLISKERVQQVVLIALVILATTMAILVATKSCYPSCKLKLPVPSQGSALAQLFVFGAIAGALIATVNLSCQRARSLKQQPTITP